MKLRFTWLNLWYSGYIFAHLETEFLALPRSQTEFVNEVVIICSLNLLRFTPMRRGGDKSGSERSGDLVGVGNTGYWFLLLNPTLYFEIYNSTVSGKEMDSMKIFWPNGQTAGSGSFPEFSIKTSHNYGFC